MKMCYNMPINMGGLELSLRTYLICRIVITFLFLVISTTIWITRRPVIYHEVDKNITSNEISFKELKKGDKESIYNLTLSNKENLQQKVKVYIVPEVLKENISNNYIKYQIGDNSIKTLNMDGMILVDTMESLEEKNISLKIWISATYEGDLSYSGRVVVL